MIDSQDLDNILGWVKSVPVLIEDWLMVHAEPPSPWQAPECRPLYLEGIRATDGKRIRTSRIVKNKDGVVVTASGTFYQLGTINASYKEWKDKT